jgi:hypothetical protein
MDRTMKKRSRCVTRLLFRLRYTQLLTSVAVQSFIRQDSHDTCHWRCLIRCFRLHGSVGLHVFAEPGLCSRAMHDYVFENIRTIAHGNSNQDVFCESHQRFA